MTALKTIKFGEKKRFMIKRYNCILRNIKIMLTVLNYQIHIRFWHSNNIGNSQLKK